MKYVVYGRKKYTVNTDPLRRCYYGVHYSSEERWTEWTDLLSYGTPEEAEASANDFRKINPDREYKVVEMMGIKHGDIIMKHGTLVVVRDYTFNGKRFEIRELGPAISDIPVEEVTLRECNTFTVDSCIYLTDPCYCLGTWCSEPLYNKCLPGQWTGRVFGERDFLVAHHVDHPITSINAFARAKKPLCDLGVDSGMISILNRTITGNEYECLIGNFDTYNEPLILNVGIISNTKYGDGGYGYRYITNDKKQIVAIAIDMR